MTVILLVGISVGLLLVYTPKHLWKIIEWKGRKRKRRKKLRLGRSELDKTSLGCRGRVHCHVSVIPEYTIGLCADMAHERLDLQAGRGALGRAGEVQSSCNRMHEALGEHWSKRALLQVTEYLWQMPSVWASLCLTLVVVDAVVHSDAV